MAEAPGAGRRAGAAHAALGIALGLAFALAVLLLISHRKAPPPPTPAKKLAGGLLREDSGSLDEILVHYVPRLEPLVADAYADFLGTLPASTRVVAVIPKDPADAGTARDGLARLLARIDPTEALAARTRVVEVDGPISVWSKDRALVLAPDETATRTGLVIPVPPDPRWKERANDWRTLEQVAGAMPERFYVRQLPIEFDAGDFDVAGDEVLVDDNLVTKNGKRGVGDVGELRKLLEGAFARPVVVLGRADGDVPRHHMSMYMAALSDGLGGRVALVGDPREARALVGDTFAPGELDPDTGAALRADFSDATVARFDAAAAGLTAAGWRVVRIPEVPFLDKTYMAYTNGVYETRGSSRIAWMPTFDLPALDARATQIYESLGWQVRPVRARHLYAYHGTIGCLVNVLARGP
jgi:hypothetical protein